MYGKELTLPTKRVALCFWLLGGNPQTLGMSCLVRVSLLAWGPWERPVYAIDVIYRGDFDLWYQLDLCRG